MSFNKNKHPVNSEEINTSTTKLEESQVAKANLENLAVAGSTKKTDFEKELDDDILEQEFGSTRPLTDEKKHGWSNFSSKTKKLFGKKTKKLAVHNDTVPTDPQTAIINRVDAIDLPDSTLNNSLEELEQANSKKLAEIKEEQREIDHKLELIKENLKANEEALNKKEEKEASSDKNKIDINYKANASNSLSVEIENKPEYKSSKAIKSKLANMTSANPRDLCIRSKLNKDTVDLAKYFDHEALVEFFKDNTAVLHFNKNLGASDIIDRLSKTVNIDEFLNICDEEGITLSDKRREDLEKNFEKNKIKIRDEIVDKSEDQQKKFDKIVKANDSIVENTGIHSLYIAYDFLVGTTKTGVAINAPLVLFPITLESENNEPYKIHHLKPGFVVNEKLLTLLKKEYDLEWVIADMAKTTSLSDLIQTIKNGLKSTFEISSYENHEFKDYTSSELSKLSYLSLYDSALLGIFEPSGGALKDNLEYLVDNNIDPFVSNKDYSDIKFIQEEEQAIPLLEIGRPLNIYQKYAVRSALSQNTLIYGPPGTGKSEVISNIIANAISFNKSVLVVSEKKAALDVLHERLQDLSNLALFIYDLDDKKSFYDKIAALGDKVNNMRLEGITPTNYNLRQTLENQKKWNDVDEIHKDLRKHIWALVQLNKKLDSNGTNFTDYLIYRSHCDDKIVQYAKESNVIEYVEAIMDKYFFDSVDKLMYKFNEYKDFLLAYGIDEPGISEKLKHQKIMLTKLQVEDNLLEYLTESEARIKSSVELLRQLLRQYNLEDDKHFIDLLRREPNIIKRQRDRLYTFKSNHEDLVNSGFLNFLVNNYDNLATFLNKFDMAKEDHKAYIIAKFLSTGKILKIPPLFAKHKDLTDDQKNKLVAIRDFLDVPEARYQYIPLLVEREMSYIDKNTVHFYLNNWLLNTYVKDLGAKQFTFFDDEVLVKLNPIKDFNSKIYNEYKLLINYDNEIMKDYLKLMKVNINEIVNADREKVLLATEDASKQIERCFIDYLKNSLVQLSKKDKERMQEIFSIARRGGNNSSIKDFVQEYYKELSLIFPIWISLPELVAQIFPLKSGLFDYGIFDEASQMFVERAYPLIYRCKTSIVAGDDKQLKPTSFFASRVSDNANYELNDNDIVDSLLDRAKVSLWSAYNLRNHYRSTHRELIQFSNDFIYDHKLHFATKNGSINTGIEVINAHGTAEDSVNEKEADMVIDQLEANVDKYNKIIVITFGVKQSQYIEQMLSKNSQNLENVYKKWQNGQIVITNLENVQGNEGDLVILSVCYGKNKEGVLRNAYGPLIMDGGINRLNVAITRAKDKMIIIKSLYGSDMNVNLNNKNAVVFKSFIEYCDKLTRTNKSEVANKELNELPMLNKTFRPEVANFLKECLENKNLTLVENYDIGSRVIDFALMDKKTKNIVQTFVLQPWSKDVNLKDYLEHIDNYYFLRDRGYKVDRIEEYSWTYNKESIKNDIYYLVDELTMSKPEVILNIPTPETNDK